MKNISPSEKQIAFAEAIAEALSIDFPQSSHDFTKWAYWNFISTNIQAYKEATRNDYDDEPGWNDACWGFSNPFLNG